jgi:PAS domain S-box-containing protein
MPFGSSFETRNFKLVRSLRNNVAVAFGVPIVTVALACLARLALGDTVMQGVPFITLYPAIIISTFIGGLGPGILSVGLAALAAWSIFLPPEWSLALDARTASTLIVFVLVNAANVAMVLTLDGALTRVLAREQEMRELIETAPSGIVVVDDRGVLRLVNASAEKLFGYTRSELIGQSIEILVPDRLMNAHQLLRQAYMSAPESRPMGAGRDLKARRKDGSEFSVEIGLSALRRNREQLVLATVLDISERKKFAEQQQLLIRELHHRTQNLFAVVQSIVNRSVTDPSAAEAKQHLLNRLHALARTHTILAESAWTGASLGEIIMAELAPMTERVAVHGCEVVITPAAAQSFVMIVHELATNAVKYGALSVPSGQITISGTFERGDGDEMFVFKWVEAGGPPVQTPTRRGFGTSVLTEATRAFGAQAKLDYAPEGVRYELLVRRSTIEPASRAPARGTAGTAARSP